MNGKVKPASPLLLGWPVFLVFSLAFGVSPATSAQADREFVDKANGFKISLIANWRAESYTDAVGRKKIEFIFEKRDQGLLRITRENLAGSSLKDVVRRETENFTLCNSCVSTGQDEFAGGSLSGIRVAHYYVERDRRMAGTFYFMQEGEAVWILRFSGRAESSGMTLANTDALGRTFSSVSALDCRPEVRAPVSPAVSTSSYAGRE